MGYPTSQWVAAGLILMGGLLFTIFRGGSEPKAEAPREFSWNDALSMCRYAYKAVAKDPEKAEIPYVPANESGDEFYFAWGQSTKMMRMRNGLGLETAASGSCIVSKSQRRITALTLNGETII